MFERKIYSEMLHWKEAFAPKYALFLKGARRVGKTTLAQCLKANGHRQFFYARRNEKTRKTEIKIDFLIRKGKKIVPIEVKSSSSSSIKSLVRFKEIYGKHIDAPIVLHHGKTKMEAGVQFFPYYMAALL